MKTYYQQLKKVVFAYVEHYITDFTKHDRKALFNYKGDFFYGIRKTGTDLFRISEAEKAIRQLLDKKDPNYYTAKGLKSLYDGNDTTRNHYYVYSLLEGRQNDRFFIGENMQVREVCREEFVRLFNKRLDDLRTLAEPLKGCFFVYELYKKTLQQEQEKQRQRMIA